MESAFIYPETFPRVWFKIVCGTYSKQTYVFASPAGLLMVVTRVSVGFSEFLLWFIALVDLKYPSISLFKPYFVDCWLVCNLFIVTKFIDIETCPLVWLQIFGGIYPNQTYVFASTTGLWAAVARVMAFVISPVDINTLIEFNAVPQVLQVCSCLGKCWIKGHKGLQRPIGLIPCNFFALYLEVVCFIFVFVNSCLFL